MLCLFNSVTEKGYIFIAAVKSIMVSMETDVAHAHKKRTEDLTRFAQYSCAKPKFVEKIFGDGMKRGIYMKNDYSFASFLAKSFKTRLVFSQVIK